MKTITAPIIWKKAKGFGGQPYMAPTSETLCPYGTVNKDGLVMLVGSWECDECRYMLHMRQYRDKWECECLRKKE